MEFIIVISYILTFCTFLYLYFFIIPTDPLAEKTDVDLYDILHQYMTEHPTRGEVAIVDHIRSLGFRVKRKKLRDQVSDANAKFKMIYFLLYLLLFLLFF